MESSKIVGVHVTLKGVNYLLWSRTIKSVLCGRGLWAHVEGVPKRAALTSGKAMESEGSSGVVVTASEDEAKWYQDDQVALVIMQSSLDPAIHEAYSYCESAKHLWDTLKKVYGNLLNLSRIYEVKKAISNLSQEDMEFTQWFGKYRSLWAELEMLRPPTVDPVVLGERMEQDKVFGLMMNLNPAYNDLICHLLRQDKLPNLEEVCGVIQREQGSRSLLGSKGELLIANKAFKPEEKKVWVCDHCKKKGHSKERCWVLYPHLKQNRWDKAKANVVSEDIRAQVAEPSSSQQIQGGTKSMVAVHDEYVKKSDLAELIKSINALKESSGISYHSKTHSDHIVIDSGASHNMIKNPMMISNLKPAIGNVVIANGKKVPIKGIGELKLFDMSTKAFYMPDFTSNLLSVNRTVCDLNCRAIFEPHRVCFQDIKSGKVLGEGFTKDGLYLLEEIKSNPHLSCFSSSISSVEDIVWHARLGHPHNRALSLLLPNINFKNDDCEACILGKHCKSVFPKSSTLYENCFDLIHSDVWTAPCDSRDQYKYFVTFIDEKSKYTWLTLLPSKDRVLEAFTNFQTYVTNQYNAKIKIMRTDNGGEYTSNSFKQLLTKLGIMHQTSCPYTPQQNGVAERKNRHLMEVARAMMFHTNVPKRFWSDAVVTACYVINRIPTKVLKDMSPFEVLNQTKPSINHLRVFGCVSFVLVPDNLRNKLETKSTKGVFIGYPTTQKGYKCYIPETRKVLVSRDVKFMENKGYFEERNWTDIQDLSNPAQHSKSGRTTILQNILENMGIWDPRPPNTPSDQTRPQHLDHNYSSPSESEGTGGTLDHNHSNVTDRVEVEHHGVEPETEEVLHDLDTMHTEDIGEQFNETAPLVQPLRRSQRIRKASTKFGGLAHPTRVYFNKYTVAHPTQIVCNMTKVPAEHQTFITQIDKQYVPMTYNEAKEHKVWRDAIGEEYEAMDRNHTWDEATLPPGKKAVTSRWIFTIKYKSDGQIERHKARLVARGFTQTYGEDYHDTFAPVAKLHTVRVVLSLATNLDWDLWQMDVKNAFLQGELEDEVYMVPPPGLEHIVAPRNVLRLRKAIYGLKQSPRAWYHKLSHTLRDHGFRKSEADHTLFTLQGKNGIVVVLVYVDDIIITGSDKEGIKGIKEHLKFVFDIKDLGEMKYFLGIEVCRSKEGLFLSQRKYTLDLLNECDIGRKSAKTPLEDTYKATCKGEKDDEPFKDVHQYRKMVGKLIYLTITRPDLCFAVNQVSQHMQAPKKYHWEMVDRILRYIKGTPGQGIWMGRNENTILVGYCDADWAGDRQDRKSTTGYCTFLGGNLVTWKSKKQKVVSCSSAEAEYRAMRKLTDELIWLKALLKDLGVESNKPITMHCDNQAAIHIASNSVFHERTKHIEVDCHKVREKVEQGVVLPCYTRSSDQLADIFTKAASSKVCEFVYSKLGLIDVSKT